MQDIPWNTYISMEKPLFDITIFSAAVSQVKSCRIVGPEKISHPIRMVKMRMGQHGVIRILYVYPQFLGVFQEQF